MACMRAEGAMRSSSGRPKGYEAASITNSMTPQDQTSAICKYAHTCDSQNKLADVAWYLLLTYAMLVPCQASQT